MTRAIAIIPARGGSKRLPGKSWKMLLGKPLIDWTLDPVIESGCFDQIIVTSDSDIVLRHVSRNYSGRVTAFSRKHFSPDKESATVPIDEIAHLVPHDIRAHFLPTWPMRTADQIERAMYVVGSTGALWVRSVRPDGVPCSYMGLRWASGKRFGMEHLYWMSEEENIDINTQENFDEAERRLKARGH